MPRLFVAVRPPAPIRALLADISHGVPGARWQDDEQLHLTLRFIGEVDSRTGDDIIDALAYVRGAPFEIAIDGVGTFARRGRIDTLWAGVTPFEPIARLHRSVDHAVVGAGLMPEGRAFHPHVTMARGRIGPADPFLAANSALSSTPFIVDQFALYESHLGVGGAHYAMVERWSLR